MSRTAISASSLLTGLVDYWKLEETGANAVGANGTTLVPFVGPSAITPGTAAGKLGNGRTFRALTNDALMLAAASAGSYEPGSSSFSAAAWVKFDTLGADRQIFGKQNGTAVHFSWRFNYQNAGTKLSFIVFTTDGVNVTRGDFVGPVTGQWYHLVGVVDWPAQKLYYYVNGKLVQTVSLNATIIANGIGPSVDGDLRVGCMTNTSSSATAGTVDGTGYWNRALTPGEVALLWNNGNGLEHPFGRGLVTATQPRVAAATSSLLTSLVDGWRLEESTGNCVGVNGTLLSRQGTTPPTRAAGKLGFGQSFAAADSSRLQISPLDTTSFSPGMGSFSVQAWTKLTAIGADRALLSKFRSVAGGFEWRLYMQTSGGDHWRFQIVNDNTATVNVLADGPLNQVATGQWYHLVGTWNTADQKLRLYINGAIATTISANAGFAASGVFVGSGNFMVGNTTAATVSANGVVDAPYYWSRALTPAEVLLLWNNGNGLEYPFGRGLVTSPLLRSAA